MNSETRIWLTVILSIVIILSPLIAGFGLNCLNAFELHSAYYLVTRTDFSIGIKMVALLAIIKINRTKR